jgi:hypothetical protein
MNSLQASQVSATEAKGSRINADVERVLLLTRGVHNARERVTRHATALGYFSDAPSNAGDAGKIAPISNNLQNALGDLDRAIDALHGALNLFD